MRIQNSYLLDTTLIPSLFKKAAVIYMVVASPIDHSFRRNFERYAEKNVTGLASVSGASLSLYIAISIAMAISIHERTGKL